MQGLRRTRRLAEGKIDLRVGNGARVAALSVGTYDLVLPSGLVLSLESCYYVPALSRNIISVSCLDKSGFSFAIKNKSCSSYQNDLFYGKFDEIYEEWNLFVKSSNDVSEKGCQFKSRFPIHTLDEALRIMDNYINYVYYDNFNLHLRHKL